MAYRTSSSTRVGGKGKFKRLGMNTITIIRQPPHVAQKPHDQESNMSEIDEQNVSDILLTQSKHKTQPIIDESKREPGPSSQESSPEPHAKPTRGRDGH